MQGIAIVEGGSLEYNGMTASDNKQRPIGWFYNSCLRISYS